jgi:hypothetical protein
MPEPKMKKCRNCGKEVEVDKEGDIEFVHDCGWSEAKARAQVRKQQLLKEVEEDEEKARKKAKGGGGGGTNIFGW